MKRSGFTLVAAIFIITIMAIMAFIIHSFTTSDAKMAVENYSLLKAFYIANAGQEYYLGRLKLDDDWSNPPALETRSFSGGRFTLSLPHAAKDKITIVSTGICHQGNTTYERKIINTIQRLPGGVYSISDWKELY